MHTLVIPSGGGVCIHSWDCVEEFCISNANLLHLSKVCVVKSAGQTFN